MKKKKTKKKRRSVDALAMDLTRWMGSTSSLIAHTVGFIAFLLLGILGVDWDTVFLFLTTIVSLEAIYLSLFIQMTVNRNTESLEEVESDLDELQEDIEEITEDVGEMEEHMEEIREDVEEITEDDKKDDVRDETTKVTLENIHTSVQKLMEDIEKLKGGR